MPVPTDVTPQPPTQGDLCAPADEVFYDGECSMCSSLARRFDDTLRARHFDLRPLQTAGASAQLGVSDENLLDEMRVRLRDGQVLGGADALAQIARRIWWAWPLWAVSRVPGVMPPLRLAYAWVARRRRGVAAAPGVPVPRLGPTACAPLVLLPIAALLVRSRLPAWAFMWGMAFALYAGCKWLTYCEARTDTAVGSRWRTIGYLLGWPGMDARAFLRSTVPVRQPAPREWVAAVVKAVGGAGLTWGVARLVPPQHPLLAGWIAMIGAVFVLHFGTFHLLSLLWRRIGVNAEPIMRNPARATSLTEFWGRRWNIAFHELARQFTLRPLRRVFRPAVATLLVFVVSGLIHELVISLPARAAYGWPTTYFVLQGVGMGVERSPAGRRWGIGRGGRGRMFTLLVAAVPAVWLFPPPFIHNVVLPMLEAIGAR